jgi:hypothetical protein
LDWCDWGTYRLLYGLNTHVLCGFAARRARSVQRLWPESGRGACERAVQYVEHAAAGEYVATDISTMLQALDRFSQLSGTEAWAADAAGWALLTAIMGADAAWAAGRSTRAAIAAIAEDAKTDEVAGDAWLEVADDLQRLLDAHAGVSS